MVKLLLGRSWAESAKLSLKIAEKCNNAKIADISVYSIRLWYSKEDIHQLAFFSREKSVEPMFHISKSFRVITEIINLSLISFSLAAILMFCADYVFC